MCPEARGRTSTNSTASVRPVNSSHSTNSRCSTGATVTVGGGACAGAPALDVQPAAIAISKLRAVRLMTVRDCGWDPFGCDVWKARWASVPGIGFILIIQVFKVVIQLVNKTAK